MSTDLVTESIVVVVPNTDKPPDIETSPATHASAGTHSCDVIIANDGTNAYYSQFGDVHTGNSLFTLSADVNSGNMRLLVTPANTNTTIDTFQIRHS